MADDIDPKTAAARRTAGRAARGGTDAPARTKPARAAPIPSPKPTAETPPAVRAAPRPAPMTATGGSGPPVIPPTGRGAAAPAADPGGFGLRPTPANALVGEDAAYRYGTESQHRGAERGFRNAAVDAAGRPGDNARTFDSTRNVPAVRPGGALARPSMPALRPGALPQGGMGGPAALATVAAGLYDTGKEYVNREFPRVRATEDAVARETGVSILAADAPSRISGRRGGVAIPAVGGRPGPAIEAAEFTGPRRQPEGPPAPDAPAARAAARPAPRRPASVSGPSDRMSDPLNQRELDRIGRVNRGQEADRPPQFAKGGMVKKPAPFAPTRAAGPPKAPKAPGPKLPAFLTGGPAAVKAAPKAAPKATKPAFPGAKPLPFSKGGMVKGKSPKGKC